MKKSLMFIVCWLAAIVGSCGFAQQYNGPGLYDAVGNVKSIKISPTPMFSADKVEFMKDGHIIDSTLTFDWNGKAIGKKMQIFKSKQNVDLKYDDNNRISEAAVESSTGLIGGFRASISYSGDHPGKMIVTETKGKNPKEYTYSYSNYTLDDAGNWVSRDVDLSVIDINTNENKKTEHFTENRNIQYYE